ncbi:PREDICTED: hepatocyte growth factor-regulated tyrosine kinase substrate-like [Rhagoletis zephyria]|uniref:hepatocyte growth factor-regulated tyrosine kinase substrate-like n=1 Tax=Rhagoletis zephyria TaxID=28612 RepID=UPI000811799A|nr:PREDICTED: hepatocyte growth factor-regulated tyrosine kinase substrate-like [Rhagoletis zephyria]
MFKSSSTFDKQLDKATSLSNLEPDWASILQLCDSIRMNDVQPKYALSAIRKKLFATNPNVVLMGLRVLESCVKNCGSLFHNEVATRQFMDDLEEVIKQSNDVNVRDETLRIIQVMAYAFRNDPGYRAVGDKMKYLKHGGYQFPVLKESDAMFSADSAPDWADGEVCHRCRVQFAFLVRKHHCRNCGQVFCATCSAKTSTIPRFGIEREVRVCDVCYDKINSKPSKSESGKSHLGEETKAKIMAAATSSAANASAAAAAAAAQKKTEQEIQEEEELQLALALSQSEAEEKAKERSSGSFKYPSSSSKMSSKSSSKKSSPKSEATIENDDPEMARYLNREYWENRTTAYPDYEPSPSPSAPQSNNLTTTITPKLISSPTEDTELESFTNSLRSTIEIFVNRLNSNKLRGRSIASDNGVQALFMNLTNLHSQLIMHTQQTNESRTNCERLQDKISQIRDARAALDALREEHREQMRRAAEEAERIRQQQMAQKLEIMRKKKQEYLQYQREIALQRMHDQEREFIMRQEQMKFASANAGAVPPSQWNNGGSIPASGYYISNAAYAMPTQQQQQQPPPLPQAAMAPGGQYVQSNLPHGSGMVNAHHAPMPSSTVPMAVPPQPGQQQPQPLPPQQQVMQQPPPPQQPQQQQYIPAMYMPQGAPVAGNYQAEPVPQQLPPGVQQQQQPPVQYTMAQPVASVAPPQMAQPPPAPQPPAQPEATEELLINFD